MNVYEIITKQIIEKLEQGEIPWQRPWIGGPAKNLISNKPYQGINTLLLACSGFSNPYWLTFKQAQAKGGHVKKGEKGTIICFWKTYSKKSPTDDDPDNEESRYVLRYYRVFNVDQCEGIEVPKTEQIEFNPIEQCEKIVDEMPNKPKVKHESSQAFYSPSTDHVNMPKPESFVNSESYYSVLFN